MTAQPDWQAIGKDAEQNVAEQNTSEPHVAEGSYEGGSLRAAVVPVPVPAPPPVIAEGREPPQMRTLLAMQGRRELEPEPGVELGPLPDDATRAMKAIAGDIQNRLGLRLADGVRDRLPYACSEAVNAGHVKTSPGASYVLRKLCEYGVILCAGSLPPLPGKRDGTKTYIPPAWTDLLPDDELAERRRRREVDPG